MKSIVGGPTTNATPKTVLIIDDDVHLNKMLSIGLEAQGYRTLCAANADEGWKLAHAHLPDLILCDINMPGKDGRVLLREMRGDPELAHRQFVLMTGQRTTENRDNMDLGADDFLAKPFSLSTLLQCVAARLKRDELSRRIDDRALDKLRENLLSGLPREFFKPLATILGLAQSLQVKLEELTPEEIRQDLDDIHNAGQRLHRTLRNYLFLFELERDAAPRTAALLAAQDVTDAISGGARTAGLRHRRERDVVTEGAAADLQARSSDVATIVDELVDNALNYSRHGTPVTVRSCCAGSVLQITVTDHGRGMTAEEVNRLQAFWREPRERQQHSGLGVGLVVVRRLVQLLGGQFRIESEAGRGTTCHVTLPVATE